MARLIKSKSSSGDVFTSDLIGKQLELILQSDLMQASDVLPRFLEFVIAETLAGREFSIKEYTIGLHVFGRPASFSPQSDAIVRINAGRLRRLLKKYYVGPGRYDPLRIDIPKGTYIPVFEPLNNPQVPERPEKVQLSPRGLTVAVVPFSNVSNDDSMNYYIEGLAEQLCNVFVHAHELSVTVYSLSRGLYRNQADLRTIGQELQAAYVITGNARFMHTTLRLDVQLVYAEDATIIWSGAYNMQITDADPYGVQDRIAESILTSLAGSNGVIYQHLDALGKTRRSKILQGHDVIYWFYHYRKFYTAEALFLARHAIEETLAANPFYSTAWAVYSYLHGDSYLLQVQWTDDPLEMSLQLANKSLELDGVDQYGHMALGYARLLLRRKESAIHALKNAMSLSRASGRLAGMAGVHLLCCGEYERGYKYLNAIPEPDSSRAWLDHFGYALYYLKRKDYRRAYDKARHINSRHIPLGLIMQTSALGLMKSTEAHEASNNLKHVMPDRRDVERMVKAHLLDEKLIAEIANGLRLAEV